MLTSVWVSVVGKAVGRLLDETHLLGHLSNQKASGIGGDAFGGKLGLHAALAEAFK